MSNANNTGAKKRFPLTQLLRHLIQIAAFLLFPGLFVTVFHALRDVVMSLIAGTFSLSAMVPSLLTLIAVFAVTALWGRFFCGYLCAFGTMQELMAFASRKLMPRKKPIPQSLDRVLKYVKYAVLLMIVLLVWVLQLPVDSSFSPWGVFGMLVSGNLSVMGSAMVTVGFALLVAILIGSFFAERFFCRYLCPLGALFTPLSKLRLFRVRRAQPACSGCHKCTRVCGMGIAVHDSDVVTSGECIDCMRCINACVPEALKANPHPAVAGTAAALVMGSVISVGRILPVEATEPAVVVETEAAEETVALAQTAGGYADGVYTGTGTGFRGDISVQVTVQGGRITDVTVLSYRDDAEFFRQAQSGVVSAILAAQQPNVDAVSGATFSSYGIMEAVADALALSDVKQTVAESAEAAQESRSDRGEASSSGGFSTEGQPQTQIKTGGHGKHTRGSGQTNSAPSGERSDSTSNDEPGAAMTSSEPLTLTDGVYTGVGTGYRGQTQVTVTVEGGRITDITVLSYADDSKYFSRAQSGVIDAILNAQSLDVQTVSGATFSSNGILEAVANALNVEFTNPNATMSRNHH